MKMTVFANLLRLVGLLGFACLLQGCTTTKIDWNSRIGKTSYDELVVEIGPPDRQASLQDGTIVAEWMTGRATVTRSWVGGYYGPGAYYPGVAYLPMEMTYVDQFSPAFYVRLTFAPDGRLQNWKKVRR
jgi:hypothetical protein